MSEQLRADVAYITGRLNAIIREQAGPGMARTLERIRHVAEGQQSTQTRGSLHSKLRFLADLDVPGAFQVTHAFSLFFQLVNFCEERARIRHLQLHPDAAMSLRSLFRELKAARVTPHRLQRCLDALEIEPVITAHPTEARRRAVLNHIRRLTETWDNPDEVLEALWQTEEVRCQRMTPLQEVENAVYYFDRVIFDVAGAFYRQFDGELAAWFPGVKRKKAFLSFGSWVGGDRDGNPFVTPEVSELTARWHHCVAMDLFERECTRLAEDITHSAGLDAAASLTPVLPPGDPTHSFHPCEQLRQRLSKLRSKLRLGKATVEELTTELEQVQKALQSQKAHRAAARVGQLLLRAQTFGLHLAGLDFRDHSSKLQTARQELRAEFAMMGKIQKEHGPKAASRFILSMTRSAADILALREISAEAGVRDVDLVPLFETIADLRNSAQMLEELWSDPAYRRHLRARGNLQEVMVGYSDSNKDGGYLAANWHLHSAQQQMALAAAKAGIKLRLFHGKGGTIDRGGGASYRSLRAQPLAAPGGRLRITEQGEVVSLKYSNAAIAQRNLEQLTSAIIAAHCLPPVEEDREHRERWEAEMNELASLSQQHYTDLVYSTPEFPAYFQQATPVDLVEHLRLGSRPARRQQGADVRELRAIPWVFSWVQSRHLLSAWYGIGTALEVHVAADPSRLVCLREMYRDWPFFRQLIDNAEVSLAKTNLRIAREYSGLVRSAAVRDKVFGMIEQEYERSVRMVLAVCGQKTLLQDQPVLAESIRRRNPFVDPLNYIQIRFLDQWRRTAPEKRTENLRRLLALTVNGIAFGMKSTG